MNSSPPPTRTRSSGSRCPAVIAMDAVRRVFATDNLRLVRTATSADGYEHGRFQLAAHRDAGPAQEIVSGSVSTRPHNSKSSISVGTGISLPQGTTRYR